MTVTAELVDDSPLPPAPPRGIRRVTRRRLKKWLARERWEGRKVRTGLRGSHLRWTFQAVMAASLLERALTENLFGPALFRAPEPLIARLGLMPSRPAGGGS